MSKIRELRKANELTIAQAAEKLNIPFETYRSYEIGRNQADYDTLMKLADFFGVSIDYLLGREIGYNIDFSGRLSELLTEKNITQKELARACNLSTQCVSALITGRNSPTGTTVATLAKYFGCSADYLLGLTSDDDARLYVAAPSGNAIHASDETRLLEIYRKLSPDMRSTLWSLLETWSPSIANKKV